MTPMTVAHDGDDDELQRFSKGVAAPYLEMIDAVMGRAYGSASATKCDADPEPRMPPSSQRSPAASRVAITLGSGSRLPSVPCASTRKRAEAPGKEASATPRVPFG